jgi:hypothetical protein
MDFAAFLSAHDAHRAERTFARLRRHGTAAWALTGSLAIELHRQQNGFGSEIRPLNDIDFLADSFEAIPKTLSADFIFRHVHPHDPPGKTLLQSVDPETAVRVDVFRAYGNTLARAIPLEFSGTTMRIISLEDLTARTARLCMGLAAGTLVPAKHARDFLRLLPLVKLETMKPIWKEHRKPSHPESFAETASQLTALIPARRELHIALTYSTDTHVICSRCRSTVAFPLADAERVLSLLGYC